MDYLVVTGTDILDFRDRVKGFMDKGWRPQGGICVIQDSSVPHNRFRPYAPVCFHQAMVRDTEPLLDVAMRHATNVSCDCCEKEQA